MLTRERSSLHNAERFALILIFVLTTTVSRLAVRVRKLTQMVGILSKKLDSIEKNELK